MTNPKFFVLSRSKANSLYVWTLRHECGNLDRAYSRIPRTRKLQGNQWWLIVGVTAFDAMYAEGHISFDRSAL